MDMYGVKDKNSPCIFKIEIRVVQLAFVPFQIFYIENIKNTEIIF